MRIFDAHTHFFSRMFYARLASLAARDDQAPLLDKFSRHGVDLPEEDTAAHAGRIIADLDRNGIDRVVTFASIPDENEIVGEAAAGSNGRLIAWANVDPTRPATIERLKSAAKRFRYHGLVLFPTMHDYGIGDDVARPALDLARELRLVVFVHCGILRVPVRSILGLESDFPLSKGHPKDLIPVAKARPDQKFVIPHFSAGFFDELIIVGQQCPNVFVDTAGSNTWAMFQAPSMYPEDLFASTVDVFGVERVLYGSDSAGYPRGYRKDILDRQIRAMHDAGIRPADQELILGGNLMKLLQT